MKSFLLKILKFVKMSLTSDNSVSSTRIQSYFLLILIILLTLGAFIIEGCSFYHSLHSGVPYVISNQYMTIFISLLALHLSVLFQRTKTM